MSDPAVIVLAKAPVAGRSKTRLCPPCSLEQAAALAQAALTDTLTAVGEARVASRWLVLDGAPGEWLPNSFRVAPQRGRGLDERLAGAFEDVGGPALLVGMDTPQVSARTIEQALAALVAPGVDAVLGPALDGGYWCVGLRAARRDAFVGVPMSCPTTWAAQRTRLGSLGLRVAAVPPLRDVDTIDDAWAVAAEAPRSRFAAALAKLEARDAA